MKKHNYCDKDFYLPAGNGIEEETKFGATSTRLIIKFGYLITAFP